MTVYLNNGIHFSYVDPYSVTMAVDFMNASVLNKLDIIDSCLLLGLDIDTRCKHGQTALHYACEHGNIQIVERLLDHGANVNAVNLCGETALHKISLSGNECAAVGSLLLERGANPNILNSWGETPLHIACAFDHCELAKSLIDRGANVLRKH